MDGFKDGGAFADISGRRDAQTADQTGAKIRQNVTVQIWHHQNVEIRWVLMNEKQGRFKEV